MGYLTEVVIPVQWAEETLKYLSDLYTIIVATNGPSVATQQKLEKINCFPFIKEILSADMFWYMKPRVEFFEAIQERYPLPKENYLIIGDSLKSDVGFGMRCWIDSCRFDRGDEEITEEYQPTFTIKDLSDLKEIL